MRLGLGFLEAVSHTPDRFDEVAGLVESAGYEGLGSLVWPIGYGSVVLAAWYVWIRPMDLGAHDSDDTDLWGPDEESTDPER
jgi:hypothetical protein